MSTKTATWIGAFVGSTVIGMVPAIWNGSIIAYLLWSGIGAIAGIYAGFKLAN